MRQPRWSVPSPREAVSESHLGDESRNEATDTAVNGATGRGYLRADSSCCAFRWGVRLMRQPPAVGKSGLRSHFAIKPLPNLPVSRQACEVRKRRRKFISRPLYILSPPKGGGIRGTRARSTEGEPGVGQFASAPCFANDCHARPELVERVVGAVRPFVRFRMNRLKAYSSQ